tara:strand:+ start:264 stop:749 length:486 start_codon:yes stop_codon:yes gene_type:complete
VKKLIDYEQFVDKSLRGVIKLVLNHILNTGLQGDHHLYITFLTQDEGVMIPEYLINEYPNEITIVIQHQFWNLEVTEEFFSISLSFNNNTENIKVPYKSITSFADPSVNFGLQFKKELAENIVVEKEIKDGENAIDNNAKSKTDSSDNVISFNDFHKNLDD